MRWPRRLCPDAMVRMSPQILICQNLRNNLQHPNEYLRGATLRFLCRIKEVGKLETLLQSCTITHQFSAAATWAL